ncbi:DNA modification methylase [Candidatus Parcubacteria bacterium]|nr:DNA modification methylase [Candidatus Parcubacteria bacterium]
MGILIVVIMQKLHWCTIQKRVNDLVPQEINPRSISDKQLSDLTKSLKKFNLVEIPAVDFDGRILAGHQRIKALKLLGRGEEIIDIRVPNRKLTKKESDQYLIGSNKLGGDWDFDLLKGFELETLELSGFDKIELSNLFDKEPDLKETDFDEQAELKKIKTPKTKTGDLILLGKSKLICEDSNNPKVLKRLFGKEKTSLILSDPIYNLQINYNKGIGGKRDFGGNVEDNRTEEEYIDFLRKNIKTALTVTNEDCHVFYFNTEEQIWILQTLYREFGIRNRRVCLWIKNGSNETPSVAFSKCYEPAIYGTLNKPYLSSNEYGLNQIMNSDIGNGNESLDSINLWTSKRVSGKQMNHATQKPVDLYHKAIRRCSKIGDIILDSFGGSGSTLIACTELKRRAYVIEKEPIFCDLIIRRYEALTGEKAVIIHSNEER